MRGAVLAEVKVTIDRDECISCESCWTICPEAFGQNLNDSWSQLVAKYQIGGDPATRQFLDATAR